MRAGLRMLLVTLPFTPTRILFFTGKGGVGKTSLACATAIALADEGRRVLLVSTDPASNLDEVLGVALSGAATSVPGVPGLHALNIDPEAAAREYRERVVGPLCAACCLPTRVANIEEQLSGACTTEIAAFDEFSRLLGDGATTAASITSSSTPRPPATRCACSSCPRPGTGSSRRTSAARRASARCRVSRRSSRSTAGLAALRRPPARPRWPW